ncbi:unnamed protein product [Lymnaea stagnalis]|uniref:VWFD domain-containing protein n=1 Tax=Lymnaea stagnalis TaxID=6523 RepID=A0AAV2HZK2_LYMST
MGSSTWHFWFLAASIIIGIGVATESTPYVTSGESGQPCEGGKRRCLKGEATCVSNKCICHSRRGNGNFACYQKGEIYTEIKNDPLFITFAFERVEVPLPCRYLLVHVITKLWSAQDQRFIGTCSLKVYSYAYKVHGKFFAAGFDAYVGLQLNDSPETYGVSIRVTGTAEGGLYKFEESGKDGPDGVGPWGYQIYGNFYDQDLRLKTDEDNNRVYLNVEKCGIRINFRPANLDQGKDQTQVPGLSVALVESSVLEWPSKSFALGLAPFLIGPTLGQVANRYNVGPSEAFLALALYGAADQEFPNAPSKCSSLVNTVKQCTDHEGIKEALDICGCILSWPRFVRCWTGNSVIVGTDPILELYEKCFNAMCRRIRSQCLAVEQLIRNSSCSQTAMPVLTGFNCHFFADDINPNP